MEKIKDKFIPILTILVIILISISLYCIFKFTLNNKKESKLENGITAVFFNEWLILFVKNTRSKKWRRKKH